MRSSEGEVEMEIKEGEADNPKFEQKLFKTRFTTKGELDEHLKTYGSAAVIAKSYCLEPTAMKAEKISFPTIRRLISPQGKLNTRVETHNSGAEYEIGFTAEKELTEHCEIHRSGHETPDTEIEMKPDVGDVSGEPKLDEKVFICTTERELEKYQEMHRYEEVVPETLQSKALPLKSYEPLSPNISIKEEEKPQEKQDTNPFRMNETQWETNLRDLCDQTFINSGFLTSDMKGHESALEPNVKDPVINMNETCSMRHEPRPNMLVDASFQTSTMDARPCNLWEPASIDPKNRNPQMTMRARPCNLWEPASIDPKNKNPQMTEHRSYQTPYFKDLVISVNEVDRKQTSYDMRHSSFTDCVWAPNTTQLCEDEALSDISNFSSYKTLPTIPQSDSEWDNSHLGNVDSSGSDNYSAQKLVCAHCREEELNRRLEKHNATGEILDIKAEALKSQDDGYKMSSDPDPEGTAEPEKSRNRHTQRLTGPSINQYKLCYKSFTENTSFNYRMAMHKLGGMRKCATTESGVNLEKPSAVSKHKYCFYHRSHIGALTKHFVTHSGEKSFQCDQCDKTFAVKCDLTQHLRTHCGEKPFQCDHCGNGFPSSSRLIRHLRTHSGEKPFQCDQCEKTFALTHHLTQHLRTHTGERPYRCDQCDKAYTETSSLTRHLESHSGEKPFQCHLCNKSYMRKDHLTRHLRTHSGEKPFQCDKTFVQKSDLTQNFRTQNGEKPFQCDQCDKAFAHKNALTVHFRTHSGAKPFQCTQCGKRFAQKGYLTHHLRTHSGEKPFQCDQCDKSFAHKNALTVHYRTHSGENPFQCDLCGKAFALKHQLSQYLRRHSGEKPYLCNKCSKAFTQKHQLTNHLRTHGEEKPYEHIKCEQRVTHNHHLTWHLKKYSGQKAYQCAQCNKAFAQKGHLTEHIRTHTGEKPFQCDQCEKTFTHKGSLTWHLRTHSGEKPFKCNQCDKAFTD